MAKDAKIGSMGSDGNYKDEIVERSPLTSNNFNRATGYLTPKARLAFTKLRKAFTKALILRHFDLECPFQIETDASGYTIGIVLSQRTLNNLSQLHPVAFYL